MYRKAYETKDEVTIVTKNENEELMQIIYFDFDQNILKNKVLLIKR